MTRNIYLAVALLFGAAAFICLSWGVLASDQRYLLLSIGFAGPMTLLLPQLLFRRDISLLEPMSMVFLYAIIGTTMASSYLAFGEGSRHATLTAGEDTIYFVTGGIWLLLGIAVFSVVYALFPARIALEKILPRQLKSIPPSVIFLAIAAGLAISALGTVLFINSTGGFSLASISQKRWMAIQGEGGDIIYGGGGHYRMLAGMAAPLAIYWLCYFLQNRTRSPFAFGAVAILALSAMAVPFLSSSRSDAVFVIFQLAAAYLCYRKVSPIHISLAVLAILLLFGLMSGLRSQHASSNPFVAAASSGNGLSLVATAHISQRVPERMDHLYGESYFRWLYSPIPRALWPDKPNLGLGREIKANITYGLGGRETGGRPPGFIGEGFINFGHLGIIFASCLFAVILKGLWNTAAPLLGRDQIATSLYFLLVMPTTQFVNSGFSEMMTRSLTETFSLIVVISPVYIALRYFFVRRVPAHGFGRHYMRGR